MENLNYIRATITEFLPFILLLIIWEGIWKLIAMWKAAQNKQLGWFISLAVFNTLAILPFIYLLFFKKK
jgi:uncharacterized membrane protein